MSSLPALLSLNSLSVFSFLVLPRSIFAVLDGIAEFDWVFWVSFKNTKKPIGEYIYFQRNQLA
jgi:hypothetical protein